MAAGVTMTALRKVMDESDPSKHAADELSEIQSSLSFYNDYASLLRHLYDRTEDVSTKVQEKNWNLTDLSKVFNNSNSTPKDKKKAAKALDVYNDYAADMKYIDKNGRLKVAATVQFFTNNRRFWRQKRRKWNVADYLDDAHVTSVGAEYVTPLENTDESKLLQLEKCIDYPNKISLLACATELFSNVENLKQLRDRKLAKLSGSAGDVGDGNIYSYGSHKEFVTADKIDAAIGNADADIQAYEDAKKDTKISKKDLAAKKEAADKAEKKKKHLLHIQAENTLEGKIKGSPLTTINQNLLLGYMAFDPTAYTEQVTKLKSQTFSSDDEKLAASKKLGDFHSSVLGISDMTDTNEINTAVGKKSAQDTSTSAYQVFDKKDAAKGVNQIHTIRDYAKKGAKWTGAHVDMIMETVTQKAVPTIAKWASKDSAMARASGKTDDFLEQIHDKKMEVNDLGNDKSVDVEKTERPSCLLPKAN